MNAETNTAIGKARDLLHLAEVERAYQRMGELLGTLRVTEGRYNERAEWEYLDLMESLQLAFHIDATEHLDQCRSELRIDEEGYRLDDDGERTMVHVHTPTKAITEFSA